VIISLVNKAITAITSRLQSLSQFDGTESKVIFYFLLSVSDPDPDWIRFNKVSGSGFGIRIRIQEDKNDPQK
jgi:hypothetical protein